MHARPWQRRLRSNRSEAAALHKRRRGRLKHCADLKPQLTTVEGRCSVKHGAQSSAEARGTYFWVGNCVTRFLAVSNLLSWERWDALLYTISDSNEVI
jgi:hypothetical protein